MSKEKLTKAVIIESIFSNLGEDKKLSREQIHVIVDSFFEEIKQGLNDGQIIELRGFGTFEVRTRKGRDKARNPKTGEVVSVGTHGVAVFRPGKELKDLVWTVK